VGALPHFRNWCPYQHLGRLQAGLFFSFESSSLQVHDLVHVQICLPFMASGIGEHVSSILLPYDGNLLYFTRYSLPLRHVYITQNMLLILVANMCLITSISSCTFCFWFGLWSSCRNNLSFETWKVGCATKLLGNFRVYTLGCSLCKISWNLAYLAMKHGASPLRILKSWMFSHTCCPTSNSTCLCVLLACFSYPFWACSKSFLARAYFASRPLTISTTSLKWSLHPMEMAKSIGFLTSFPNVDSNKDIFIAKCIVELK